MDVGNDGVTEYGAVGTKFPVPRLLSPVLVVKSGVTLERVTRLGEYVLAASG